MPFCVDAILHSADHTAQPNAQPPFLTACCSPCAAPTYFRRHARTTGTCILTSTIAVFRTADSDAKPSIIRAKLPLSFHRFFSAVGHVLRTILLSGITPQAVGIDKDDPSQNAPVIETVLAVALGEGGLKPGLLPVGQSENVAHNADDFRSLSHSKSLRSMGPDPNSRPGAATVYVG